MKLKPGDIVWKWFDRGFADADRNIGRYGIMRYEVIRINYVTIRVKNNLDHEEKITFPVYETEYICKLALGKHLAEQVAAKKREYEEAIADQVKFLRDYIDEI